MSSKKEASKFIEFIRKCFSHFDFYNSELFIQICAQNSTEQRYKLKYSQFDESHNYSLAFFLSDLICEEPRNDQTTQVMLSSSQSNVQSPNTYFVERLNEELSVRIQYTMVIMTQILLKGFKIMTTETKVLYGMLYPILNKYLIDLFIIQ
jgi:hypothetical protein